MVQDGKPGLQKQGIQTINVKWYVTFENGGPGDIPAFAEACCLQQYYGEYKKLPLWKTCF